MRVGDVPDDAVLPRTEDVNEGFTVRGEDPSGVFAGTNLEGEISAVMLRAAKERFWRRNLQAGVKEEDEAMPSVEDEAIPSIEKGGAATSEGETDAMTDRDDETDESRQTPRRKRRAVSPTFTPVVSADDDRSYALLRPAARRIMGRLDDTLTILHNQRVAGLGNMYESSASDGDETDAEGRPSSVPKSPPLPSTPRPPRYRGGRPKQLQVPQDAESEQEMMIRLAREGKRKMPTFSRDGSESAKDQEAEQEMKTRLAREGKRKMPTLSQNSPEPVETSRSRSRSVSRGRRSISASSRAGSAKSGSRGSRGSSASYEADRESRLARWGLRNWRDVMGAAALAGFSPAVIARATQRCATLFGEEMTMHTWYPSAASEPGGMETMRYVPGGLLASSSDEDEADDELEQLRVVSRQSSVMPARDSSPEPESETPASRRSRSGTPAVRLCPHPGCPRSVNPFTRKANFERHINTVHGGSLRPTPPGPRSRSGTPAALLCPHPGCPRSIDPFTRKLNFERHINTVHGGSLRPTAFSGPSTSPGRRSRSGTPGAAHFCHYPNCPRAVEGFAKRTNLARHLQAVHGKRAAEFTDDEGDSSDEMDGGVHVDRFLKPIKIRKGWRADDSQRRLGRMNKKARAASEELDSFWGNASPG